jgi:hypothetical protein
MGCRAFIAPNPDDQIGGHYTSSAALLVKESLSDPVPVARASLFAFVVGWLVVLTMYARVNPTE